MEKLINNKKYLTLILIGLLTLVTGISLSFIMFDLSGSDNSIQTGQISMTYTEPSNEVILKDALPITDELGKNQDKYFEFSIMSNATTKESDKTGINIFYEISLSKKDVEGIYNQLEDKDIKIYLTKVVGNEEKVILEPTLISELEKSNYGDSLKIYDTKNKHHSNNGSITTKYRLRFWIDNGVNASDWYLKNKYEYRFVVNVNGHAPNLDIINDNTLATKIKSMYTVENGTAVVDNGYYYLKGVEKLGLDENEATLLKTYGMLGNIYLYRQEADNFNVSPTSNINKVTKEKQYIYNQELLERDMHNHLIEIGLPEEQYVQITKLFGGYLNAYIGTIYGIIDENNMAYVDDYTIDDIPTLDEAMNNEEARQLLIEIFSEMTITKDSFVKIYLDNGIINEELLNTNLELGTSAIGEGAMIETINNNFGSLSNYCLAKAHEMVDYDNLMLLKGNTVEDIPTLESIFLKNDSLLLTNTYVELNEILWKVIGINDDNTIKLMSVYDIRMKNSQKNSYLYSEMAKYFGYNEYEKSSPFLELIKDTTLNELIIKTKYEYEEQGNNKKIFAYISMPSYEDIKKSIKNNKSYLIQNDPVSVAKFSSIKDYGYFDTDGKYKENWILDIYPIITIKNIDVVGDGSIINPYKLENEKKSSLEDSAFSVAKTFLDIEKYEIEFMTLNYNFLLDYDKTSFSFEFDKKNEYSVGVSINNKCYYRTIDNKKIILDYDGDCGDKFVKINPYNYTSVVDTYSFSETKFTSEVENAKTYQWQQKIGDKWIDLEDITGRISGAKTNELTIIPDSYFSKTTEFRCVASNEFSYDSIIMTMNLTLTDGEWKYEEIEDTNKFRITGHVREDMSKSYSLTPTGETGYRDLPIYDLVIPSIINGDVIERVDSVYGEQWNYGYDHNIFYYMPAFLRNVGFEEGIKVIGKGLFETGYIKKVTLPSTIEEIEELAFYLNTITEINLEDCVNLKTIGQSAFYKNNIEKIIIPDSTIKIEEKAFYENAPRTLKLGNSLTVIGQSAFENFKTEGNIRELTIPDSVITIERKAFYKNGITKVNIGKNVKRIEPITFGNNKISEVIIPNSVEYLSGFDSNPISNITIPNSVIIIGSSAFSNTGLTDIEIPDSVTKIEDRAFAYTSNLNNIKIPDSVTKMEERVFEGSSITSATLSKNMTQIPKLLFSESKLVKITIPEGVTEIDDSAFSYSELESITIPKTVRRIGKYAFAQTELTSITIPESVTIIDEEAFSKSKFKSVIIPQNVKTIGKMAFYRPFTSDSVSLNTIINSTGLSFDWNNIITGEKGEPFITGTVLNNSGYHYYINIEAP